VVQLATKPEVLAIEEAHRAAQARLGIAGAYLALRDWGGVSSTAPVASGDAWLTRSLQMIRAIQRKSARLARAYYQLARAIETGYTLGLPEYSTDPKAITMGGLRQQYLDLLLEVADLDVERSEDRETTIPQSTDSDERWLEDELLSAAPIEVGERVLDFDSTDIEPYIKDLIRATDNATDDDLVKVDEFTWEMEQASLEELGRQWADELQQAAADRAAKLERIRKNDELTAKQVFKEVQDVHDATGSVNAGKVDKAGIDAGRDLIKAVSARDSRVMMWARGTGPNPCAWCAMLASRGFAYKSRARASLGGRKKGTVGGQMESYHENCHCYPVCRWADIENPTAPERTAHYMQLWEDEMRGGRKVERRGTKNDTLNHWRRLIAKEKRAAREAHRLAYLAESKRKA